MSDNVAITAGSGTTVAADEVVDGTLGTVKVQYIKIMDATLDGTTKAAVGAGGLKVDPTSAVAMNTGTRSATTQRVTVSTDDLVPVTGTITAVTALTNALPAGANVIGKVSIDQTTDLTTNKVRAFIHDGTTAALVKAASSGAAAASDPALVVTLRDTNNNVQSGAPVSIVAQTPTATANGNTASRVNAANSTNATSLKASAGQLYEIDVFNVAAYNVFLKFYNKASAPTVGTDTPVITIPIQAGGGYSRTFAMGRTFATGIAYAITKLQADSDTTVVAAGDLTGSIGWV